LPDHRSHKCSKKATDITDIRKTLLFGDIGIDESSAGASGVEKMTNDEQVSGCVGVTKGDIITSVANALHCVDALHRYAHMHR
jgi:nitrite reductase (NADH) large subunit